MHHIHNAGDVNNRELTCVFSPAGGTNILDGRYIYTADLLALEATSVEGRQDSSCRSTPVTGFLPLDEWSRFLEQHPDRDFAAFMCRGLTHGFRIGFDQTSLLGEPPPNFQSVRDNPSTVDSYIANEVALGRLVVSTDPTTRKNPIGIIPKLHQPGRFRLIVDLSAPRGRSVNDGISKLQCSLQYTSVDRAARLVASCGHGALMAKTDLSSAYRHVPVHADDQNLLGLEWNGITYVDRALPFGLRSAPKLFSAVADGLAWALHCEGVPNCVHYLDDFLFWGPPASPACEATLSLATDLSARLGLPTAPEKTVGPSTRLTFLGIEIDSIKQQLKLPDDKLARLRATLAEWNGKRNASKHELQVLLGFLSHAASVVRPGRVFLRRLIDIAKKPRLASQRVRLNLDCRADLAWWSTFIGEWNGIALFPCLPAGPTLISDASGTWGCGAYCEASLSWFQYQWHQSWAGVNIAVKELVPILVSAAVWGSSWRGTVVLFVSDNQAVVTCLTNRTAHDPLIAHLLRCLFFLEAHFGFEHKSQHISGSRNTAADALSRNRLSEFFFRYPQAPRSPTQVPSCLIELLSDKTLRWTSPRWHLLFIHILQEVSPKVQ